MTYEAFYPGQKGCDFDLSWQQLDRIREYAKIVTSGRDDISFRVPRADGWRLVDAEDLTRAERKLFGV